MQERSGGNGEEWQGKCHGGQGEQDVSCLFMSLSVDSYID
jgi:hypothetical protein